ncbi:MAG: hypothetical protein EOP38_24405, partial [Rubrivivax sp.]
GAHAGQLTMASTVLQAASQAALTVAEVRQQCRIDGTDEDAYLEAIVIPAVCALFESETRHRLLTTTLQDTLPCWPRTGRIDLGWRVVQEVQEVTYLDASGQLQTLPPTAYQVDPTTLPASVYVAPAAALPSMLQHPAALRVRYVAGFGDAPADVPHNVRLWLLLHCAHFWNNREAGFSASGNDMKPLLFTGGLISDYQLISV